MLLLYTAMNQLKLAYSLFFMTDFQPFFFFLQTFYLLIPLIQKKKSTPGIAARRVAKPDL